MPSARLESCTWGYFQQEVLMHGCTKFNHRPNKEQYRIVRYNMTGRLMYIPKEIASNFGHAETLGEGDLNTVKGRISDFSTVSILKILSQLRAGPKTFGNLYTHSGIRFKRSYIKYLHLCIKYGFLDREEQSPRVYYSITSKGRTMLSLFIDEPTRHN